MYGFFLLQQPFLNMHLEVCVSPKKMRNKNINPHPDTTACTKIRVCQIALTYPYILKNVELTAFAISRSISLTDPQMPYRVLPHHGPSHAQCHGLHPD